MGYSKVIKSGSQVELWEFERDLPRRNNHVRKTKRDLYDFAVNTRRRDNSARQKKAFVRLVRANLGGTRPPALVTLTMREIWPVAYSQSRFHVFTTKLRKRLGKTFRFIAVIEFQERGAVHFHALFWDLPQEIIENERSTRYIANLWGEGFVDIKQTDGSVKLAGYLGKYMAKALSDNRLSGKRAYNASHNVQRPLSLKGGLFRTYSELLIGIELSTAEARHDRSFETQWLGECRYRLYELSE